jgi:hypothetical protein
LEGLNFVLRAGDGAADEWVIDRLAFAFNLSLWTPNVIGTGDVNQPLTIRADTAITDGGGSAVGKVFYTTLETS